MGHDNLKAACLTAAMVGAAIFNATASSGHDTTTPAPARAVLSVPAPTEGKLMHLRGIAGKGTLYLRLPETARCARMEMRFVAGDFSGRRAQAPVTRVEMEIRSAAVLARLMDGAEVLSDEVVVSADPADAHADVILHAGLLPETGFVLNPGEGVWAEVFGPRIRPVPCRVLGSFPGGADL